MKPVNTNKASKGVRQVLEELEQDSTDAYTEKEEGIDYDALDRAYDKALATLQEIMLGMLPEKIKLGKAVYKNVGDGYASERIGYKHGFNDALADMEQNIRGGFNNG